MKIKNKRISTSAVFWAILLISLAVLLLLDAIGVMRVFFPEGLSIWRILLGGICLWCMVLGCIKRSPFAVFFPLAMEVILFDHFLLAAIGSEKEKVAPGALLLLIALLLSVGFSLLQGSVCKIRTDEDSLTGRIVGGVGSKVKGTSSQYFDCSEPFHATVENDLGATIVFFSNTDRYCGGSSLNLDNNLGSIVLHVPKDWHIISSIENNLGVVMVPSASDPDMSKTLILKGDNNMGSIVVKRIPADEQSEPE